MISMIAGLHPSLIGLLFFFIFFLMIVAWTYRPAARAAYRQNATIPLKDDEHVGK